MIEDALKEAQRTRLLFAEYEAALHVQAYIADTDEARARARPMVSAARGKLSGPEGVLERTEGLEQLRALENGIPIRVVPVDYGGRTHWSVDSPDDQAAAEDLIGREGELLTSYDGSGKIAGS